MPRGIRVVKIFRLVNDAEAVETDAAGINSPDLKGVLASTHR